MGDPHFTGGYTVSDVAARQARALGLSGNVSERVAWIASQALRFNSEFGNMAYGDFYLNVEGGVVLSITYIGPPTGGSHACVSCTKCHGTFVMDASGGGVLCPKAFDPLRPNCDET